jgi:lysophospholipase L1-like esterase
MCSTEENNPSIILVGASNTKALKTNLLSRLLRMDVKRRHCSDIDAAYDFLIKSQVDSPTLVTLCIGTNDLRNTKYSVKEVADYYLEMLDDALDNHPTTSFVVCLHQG